MWGSQATSTRLPEPRGAGPGRVGPPCIWHQDSGAGRACDDIELCEEYRRREISSANVTYL